MRNFLLILCLVIFNACSLTDNNEIGYGYDEYGIDYSSIEGATFYGTMFAFVYGDEIEVGSRTWTRLEEISSDTYIYTSTVSYTMGGWYSSYYDESSKDFVEVYNEGSTYTYTYYMKVEEFYNGVALYSTFTDKQDAIDSDGYQLYTYYDYTTSSPYGYKLSDKDVENEY